MCLFVRNGFHALHHCCTVAAQVDDAKLLLLQRMLNLMHEVLLLML